MLYKTSMEQYAEFKIIDLSPQRYHNKIRPTNFGNIKLPSLYIKSRSITSDKYKNMDLLPYILPIHHEYFKMLNKSK